MSSQKTVLITTGDADGIGWEVTVKALLQLRSSSKHRLVLYRARSQDKTGKSLSLRLKKKYKVHTVSSLQEALALSLKSGKELIEIASDLSPAHWVEEAANACHAGTAAAIVTAPLSKPCIQQARFSDLGHTDILKRVCGKKNAFMGFLGKHFNVVLLTGHIPVDKAPEKISFSLLQEAVSASDRIKNLLPKAKSKKPIGILGLNPHAGDSGLIGVFDDVTLKPAIRDLLSSGQNVAGPLIPDAAFHKSNWDKYCLYLCCYHDQGLIPFKMIHGYDSGVHITLGLPLIRTSVDHGTAKDIYGKNKANHRSMLEALQTAMALSLKS